MRVLAIVGVGVVLLLFAATGVAAAITVTESGDAGSLPSDAQVITGPVDLITGTISQAGLDADEDMYRICLTGGRTFSARSFGFPGLDEQISCSMPLAEGSMATTTIPPGAVLPHSRQDTP